MFKPIASVEKDEGKKKEFKYSDEGSFDLQFPKLYEVLWPDPDWEDEDNDGNDEGEEGEEVELPETDPSVALDRIQSEADVATYGTHNQGYANPMMLKLGHCISDGGANKLERIRIEIRKRDQYRYGMDKLFHWTGYGIIEVLVNHLVGFNKSLFRKEVSPLWKWGWMEALVTWLKVGEGINFVQDLFRCDDRDRIRELFSIFIPMYIVSLELLSEHNLINAPHSPAFNIPTITFLLIEFLQQTAANFDIENVHEIVRAADKHGVLLREIDGILVSEKDIEQLRTKVGRWGEIDWKIIWERFRARQGHEGGTKYEITLEVVEEYKTLPG